VQSSWRTKIASNTTVTRKKGWRVRRKKLRIEEKAADEGERRITTQFKDPKM
jgi:hypothetical protein